MGRKRKRGRNRVQGWSEGEIICAGRDQALVPPHAMYPCCRCVGNFTHTKNVIRYEWTVVMATSHFRPVLRA